MLPAKKNTHERALPFVKHYIVSSTPHSTACSYCTTSRTSTARFVLSRFHARVNGGTLTFVLALHRYLFCSEKIVEFLRSCSAMKTLGIHKHSEPSCKHSNGLQAGILLLYGDLQPPTPKALPKSKFWISIITTEVFTRL